MKKYRILRMVTAFLSCVLLLSVGALFSVCAETPTSVYTENETYAKDILDELWDLRSSYATMDTTDAKRVANPTNAAIKSYSDQIDSMMLLPEASTTDMRSSFDLIKAKAMLAGKITWIANLQEDANETTNNTVNYQLDGAYERIRNITDIATLTEAYSNQMCIEMNRTVFEQKIRALYVSTDVPEVLAIIQQSVTAVNALTDPDIHGTSYFAVFEDAKSKILLERHRVAAQAEFEEIYTALLLPPEGKATYLNPLLTSLDAATSTEAINQALLSCAEDLLEQALPGSGKYTAAYRQALKDAFAAATVAAGNDSVADLSAELTDFSQKAPRVFAKDQVEAIRRTDDDTTLSALLDEYVKEGGILDACNEQAELDFEVERAAFRAEWYRTFLSYKNQIESVLPTAAAESLVTEARNVYSQKDGLLLSVPYYATGAPDQCRAAITEGTRSLVDLLRQAEAERFRLDHIIILSDTQITADDRTALENAIAAFASLHADAAAKLTAEKQKLNDHYKALTNLVIDGYRTNDACQALRNAALDQLAALLAALDSDTMMPTALKAHADELSRRADEVDRLLDAYLAVLSDTDYPRYDENSVSTLLQDAEHALDALTDPEKSVISADPTHPTVPTVTDVTDAAVLDMQRHDAIAKIKLAANGSSLQNVADKVTEATQGILSETDLSRIEQLCDDAVFRIGAYRTADAMRGEIAELEAEIDALRALSDAQKATLRNGQDMQALRNACILAENASDSTALAAITSQFEADKNALRSDANAQALREGIAQAIASARQAVTDAKAPLTAYAYISDADRTSISDQLDAYLMSFESAVQSPSISWDRLDSILEEVLENIDTASALAKAKDEEACRQSVSSEWQAAFAKPDHYSDAHYEEIQSLLSSNAQKLQDATSVSEILSIRNEAIAKLASVPTRLDEAKANAKKILDETYGTLTQNKICYSEAALANLSQIYRDALAEIDAMTDIADVQKALDTATSRSKEMQDVRMDVLYTNNMTQLGNDTTPAQYPDSYNIEELGYWGMLSLPSAIPFDSRFTAFAFSPSADLINTLHTAIRNGSVTLSSGDAVEQSLLKDLKNCSVLTGLNLTYTAAAIGNGNYEISILLPEEWDGEEILGIVYLTDDGRAEYFPCTQNGRTISFVLSHFSDFYIVAKSPINLLPLIIILAILLLAEIVAIAILLFRRVSRENAETAMAAFFPTSFVAMRKIVPVGGLPTVIILGLCVLVAAVVLTWLILDERDRLLLSAANATESVQIPESELEPEPEPEPEIEPQPKPEPLPAVTVEEANELMSDAEATKSWEAELPSAQYVLPTGKKTEVNIDVIAAHFEPNDTVSPETLKEKGLISKNARTLKILARGTLDKPLTIIAHDFSASAIKMILLTGGTPLFAEQTETLKKS